MKFVWKLNELKLPHNVILDMNGAGITIPEVHEDHFGIYEITAVNMQNGEEDTRSFIVSGKY